MYFISINSLIEKHLTERLNEKLLPAEKIILYHAINIIFQTDTVSNKSLINAISIFDDNSRMIKILEKYPLRRLNYEKHLHRNVF